jgi:hypothetical protein
VFNPKDKRHSEFKPVFDWVFYGNGGGLIYGGTKYAGEVDFSSNTYRALLAELNRRGRMFKMCTECVDHAEAAVKKAVPGDPDFDDPHIVALVIISKCCVVCTDEHRGLRFWKRPKLYPDGVKPPKIYRDLRNARLLRNNANVAEVCRSGLKHTCRKKHK